MVTHQAIVRKGPFGGTLTTTLCGRMNLKSTDGMNSSGNDEEVTCKFCLKINQARAVLKERS
jgi:hypothetical protein